MTKMSFVILIFMGALGWGGSIQAAVQDGVQQPANCTNPCATRVHYTYSLAFKSGIAEWSVIDVAKNNQYIKAQAYCRNSSGFYQWQTATSWASQYAASSTKVCSSPYNAGIGGNGYIWTL